MTKPIQVSFNKGIQFPARLGTVQVKLAGEGKLAYAQNIDSMNDEYGIAGVVPGPALVTIGNNSELTGVPIIRQFYGSSALGLGYLYFAQGALGTKTVIRRIKDIISGSTPVIDTTGSMTAAHSGHANPVLVDMVLRPAADGTPHVYVAGKDDTDTWVQKFTASDSSPSLNAVHTNTNFTGSFTDQFLVLGSDNLVYWIGKNRVSSIDMADALVTDKLASGLPVGTYASCGTDWQIQLVIAYSTDAFGDFNRRKGGGQAGVIIWDYVSSSFTRRIPAPCRYISALVPAPDGSLLVFGGVDEGKSSIYTFTGYGFSLITSYIGDLPRSRHSVEFDSQGRILWVTVDGQYCRYDRTSGIFDHLGSLPNASSAGGIIARGIGSPLGNDFFVSSGTGSNYYLKTVRFGSFSGDALASPDAIDTPLAISGIIQTPIDATISAITLHLAKPLASGEKVVLRVYQNGSTTATEYLTMDFSVDGAVASKRISLTLPNINNFSLGVAWKMADALTTAPAVIGAVVELEG